MGAERMANCDCVLATDCSGGHRPDRWNQETGLSEMAADCSRRLAGLAICFRNTIGEP